MKRLSLIIVCCCAVWSGVKAQQTAKDSLQKRFARMVAVADTLRPDSLKITQALKDTVGKIIAPKPTAKLIPRKAALYSLMVPSMGQAYNKQ